MEVADSVLEECSLFSYFGDNVLMIIRRCTSNCSLAMNRNCLDMFWWCCSEWFNFGEMLCFGRTLVSFMIENPLSGTLLFRRSNNSYKWSNCKTPSFGVCFLFIFRLYFVLRLCFLKQPFLLFGCARLTAWLYSVLNPPLIHCSASMPESTIASERDIPQSTEKIVVNYFTD